MFNLINLLGRTPLVFLGVFVLILFIFGSHAGVDYLFSFLGDGCVPVDASTELCLVPVAD